MRHGEIVSFIWDVANLIRDTFKRGKYQDVILPLTVLRRLDCVLEETRPAVLKTEAKYKGELENRDGLLRLLQHLQLQFRSPARRPRQPGGQPAQVI